MSHGDDYRKGKISLEEYRKAQGLKLASKFGFGGKKVRKKARERYVHFEAQLGIVQVRHNGKE